MTHQTCKMCGSRNLVADRALAGRIICSSCGEPFTNSRIYFKPHRISKNNKKQYFLLLVIISLLFIVIIS